MAGLPQRAVNWLKRRLHERAQAGLRRGGPALQVLLFHGLHAGAARSCPPSVDPGLVCRLEFLEARLKEALDAGFRFLHPDEFGSALGQRERVALLTFDDGYANNFLALPLLEKLQIPAVIFVTTDALLRGRSYWWDVLARETARGGLEPTALSALRRDLKAGSPAEIEARLEKDFGPACFQPWGEHDRPMTQEELVGLAGHALIRIGNHTHRHALLAQLDQAQVCDELATCQRHLTEITGRAPSMLAYPNGRWNAMVAAEAARLGLKHAFTTERALSPLPLSPHSWLGLPRSQPVDAEV